ncbi:MAG: ABC transporter permease subunit [Deltaproteobacteria bacterium]|nr:ABC transporter permease subunit [Deltaproteobacteria bacterium]
MSAAPADFLAMARLDAAELRRSRWPLFSLALYAALAAGFVYFGMRESSVVAFTGMGRVLFSLSHALVFFLPLLALGVTGQAINRAREDGSLELWMSLPVRRGSYLAAVTGVRALALIVPALVAFAALAAIGRFAFAQPVPWQFLARSAAISTCLLLAYAALGVAISAAARTQARALAGWLLAWLASVALLDFGLIAVLLHTALPPRLVFFLAALNPVECARLALLSGAQPDLATLGPVGFYLASELGPSLLFALGLAWPLAFGALAFAYAWRAFGRDDLI